MECSAIRPAIDQDLLGAFVALTGTLYKYCGLQAYSLESPSVIFSPSPCLSPSSRSRRSTTIKMASDLTTRPKQWKERSRSAQTTPRNLPLDCTTRSCLVQRSQHQDPRTSRLGYSVSCQLLPTSRSNPERATLLTPTQACTGTSGGIKYPIS